MALCYLQRSVCIVCGSKHRADICDGSRPYALHNICGYVILLSNHTHRRYSPFPRSLTIHNQGVLDKIFSKIKFCTVVRNNVQILTFVSPWGVMLWSEIIEKRLCGDNSQNSQCNDLIGPDREIPLSVSYLTSNTALWPISKCRLYNWMKKVCTGPKYVS